MTNRNSPLRIEPFLLRPAGKDFFSVQQDPALPAFSLSAAGRVGNHTRRDLRLKNGGSRFYRYRFTAFRETYSICSIF